jgi:hypothetical protein
MGLTPECRCGGWLARHVIKGSFATFGKGDPMIQQLPKSTAAEDCYISGKLRHNYEPRSCRYPNRHSVTCTKPPQPCSCTFTHSRANNILCRFSVGFGPIIVLACASAPPTSLSQGRRRRGMHPQNADDRSKNRKWEFSARTTRRGKACSKWRKERAADATRKNKNQIAMYLLRHKLPAVRSAAHCSRKHEPMDDEGGVCDSEGERGRL